MYPVLGTGRYTSGDTKKEQSSGSCSKIIFGKQVTTKLYQRNILGKE